MKTDLSGVTAPLYVSPLVADGLFIRQDGYGKKYFYTDILWIEASANYCDFYFKNKSRITVACRLGTVERQLPDKYLVRVHRGFILNLRYVDTVAGNSLRVGEKWFPIGDYYRKNVLACFNLLDTSREYPKTVNEK
jgi:hypothetical protein